MKQTYLNFLDTKSTVTLLEVEVYAEVREVYGFPKTCAEARDYLERVSRLEQRLSGSTVPRDRIYQKAYGQVREALELKIFTLCAGQSLDKKTAPPEPDNTVFDSLLTGLVIGALIGVITLGLKKIL